MCDTDGALSVRGLSRHGSQRMLGVTNERVLFTFYFLVENLSLE